MEKCAPGGGQLLGNPRKTFVEAEISAGRMASAEILYGVVNYHIGTKPPCGKMRHTKPKCQRPKKGRIFGGGQGEPGSYHI